MEIIIESRTHYGTEYHYPICDAAKAFARIAMSKTLVVADLKEIKALGYTITQQTKELKL
jgi:hypothetical protein